MIDDEEWDPLARETDEVVAIACWKNQKWNYVKHTIPSSDLSLSHPQDEYFFEEALKDRLRDLIDSEDLVAICLVEFSYPNELLGS